jgi:hypothetical protein
MTTQAVKGYPEAVAWAAGRFERAPGGHGGSLSGELWPTWARTICEIGAESIETAVLRGQSEVRPGEAADHRGGAFLARACCLTRRNMFASKNL